ncbi:MAG: helix-turn-helix transcriptional regulator [Tissierellia bacterium]|nr:helix-turn-helix transcriptional regulator [Tissierellia bacterium]
MDFSEKLRLLRSKQRLTQGEAAKLAGVSLRTYKGYELGERMPKNHDTYINLCSAFNVDLNLLLSDEEEFVLNIKEKHGSSAKRDAQEMIDGVLGLFAGGEISLEDKKAVLDALEEAYYKAKIENQKYAPKDKS